jgi:hypothetical protein
LSTCANSERLVYVLDTPETVEVLRKTLELFGEDGERWAHHAGPIAGGTCLWGGIYQAIEAITGIEPRGECDKWVQVLGFKTNIEMFNWNDDKRRTWEEVKVRIQSAIARQSHA